MAGQICTLFKDVPDSVDLLGRVEDVADFYRQCVCTVNPMRGGTGLKIKTLESLAHGCGVVTTPAGAEGLERCRNHGLCVASDPQQFADALVHWITNPDNSQAAGDSARVILAQMDADWRQALAHALA